MQTLKIFGISAAIIIAFSLTAHMNYQDGLNDQSFKCKMIAEKTWPNVDGFFERVCKQSSERSVEVAK